VSTPVVFAPIVIALADHLAAQLVARGIPVPVVNSVPRTNRPPRYVLVLQPGGGQANLKTDQPRTVIEVVDESGIAAADLTSVVRALVTAVAPGYVGEIWVDRTRHISQVYSPDPDTNAPRFLITTELWCAGKPLI